MKRSVQNKYAILAFGTLTFICIGVIYGWSKFSSDIRTDFNLDHAQITLVYTISITMFSLGIALDGFLSRYCSVRHSVMLACFAAGAGFFLTSFLSTNTRYALYPLYGLFVGLSVGVVYGGWLSNIMLWFPNGRGLTTGILLTAIGFSGLTITPLLALVSSARGWRIAFRIMGLLFFLIAAFCPLFLSSPASSDHTVSRSSNIDGYSTEDVLRQRKFWAFCIWKLLLVSIGQALLGQLAPIVADMGGNDALQLLCVSLAVFINGISRTLWGLLSDRFGYKTALFSISIIGVVSVGSLLYALYTASLFMTVSSLLLHFASFGGAASIGPGFIRTRYGQRDFRKNNGISALTVVPGNMIVTASIGFVRTAANSYLPFFFYALPAALFSTLMCFSVFSKERPRSSF